MQDSEDELGSRIRYYILSKRFLKKSKNLSKQDFSCFHCHGLGNEAASFGKPVYDSENGRMALWRLLMKSSAVCDQ